MELARPQAEHGWLQKFIGEWKYEHDCDMGPGQPRAKFSGTETVRSLGGLWILAEGHGETPGGGEANTLLTVGFDPQKNKYVGTWIGSMMPYLWVYDGWLDESANTLTLESVGPAMSGDGSVATYRDITEFRGDEHRVFRSQIQGEDGQWHEFMHADYFRIS